MSEFGALSQWQAYRSGPGLYVIDKGRRAPICNVMRGGGWTEDERESTAALIAAAPDLLRALEAILSAEPAHGMSPNAKMSDPMHAKIGWNVHMIARAAIAKVTGEQSKEKSE